MRNRAKCKLCGDIIESLHRGDYVTCKCEEISLEGGQSFFKSAAKNYDNFLRIDDEGNEIVVRFEMSNEESSQSRLEISDSVADKAPPSKMYLLESLEHTIKCIEELPAHAQSQPVTNADLAALLTVLVAYLK